MFTLFNNYSKVVFLIKLKKGAGVGAVSDIIVRGRRARPQARVTVRVL